MSTMIRVLDETTANKIAAGEVVERPSAVVKELIENAIDAGSTKIEVEIMSGGISFMRVTDNGDGMSHEDAQLAVLRHATSKIKNAGDLTTIHTLGFRGEALPTIASVSKFSLLTRLKESEFATLVEIHGGKMSETREAGGNIGTTVKVEDLFFNTPARKKFLKTPNSEGSHIHEIILKLSISNPEIAFKFINNNKLVLSTPGNGNLFDTLKNIYGTKVSDGLLPLAFVDEGISIQGFLSKPNIIRSNRQWQTFIVNGRIIGSRSIAKAIDNAYHSLLPKSGYPLVVMNIQVPQNTIDVNVHPQKSELKFEDEGRIFKAVYKTVLDAIRNHDQLDSIAAPVQNIERHYAPIRFPVQENLHQQYVPMPSPITPSEHTVSFAEAQAIRQNEVRFSEVPTERMQETPAEYVHEQESRGESTLVYEGVLMPMGQVDRCYIIASDGKGLYIVDQHAAHERILYDRFAKMTEEIPSQQLLVHLFLDFDDKECGLILNHQDLFHQLGFSMEASGPMTMRLKEIPADIPIGEAEAVIREILEALQNLHQPTSQEIRHACLAITACRAAIKAGDLLNIRQMQILLDELTNTTLPYTCPHGRPSIIKFESGELAKMFKRT
ncbi:DNA mismatch repair endonuclease MutL [Anaerosinus massiliensis]|uniref:DNA mismatch repair endonuclease MutL n=1 Tax=Massilibacillus massiliensis TaxID=1806837 RepID=UPI000AA298A7|nr:DNA mismatch repair endonuclease MutL [Massilibacillus massiliensis]